MSVRASGVWGLFSLEAVRGFSGGGSAVHVGTRAGLMVSGWCRVICSNAGGGVPSGSRAFPGCSSLELEAQSFPSRHTLRWRPMGGHGDQRRGVGAVGMQERASLFFSFALEFNPL